MAETTKAAVKAPKVANPLEATMEPATQQMMGRAKELGIETIFDRAVTMKPCAIGLQGICCKKLRYGALSSSFAQGRH